jgi:hypothetical protein
MDGVRDGVSDRPVFGIKAWTDIATGGRRGSESLFAGAGTTGAGAVGAGVVAAAPPLGSLSEIHSSTNEARSKSTMSKTCWAL